MYLVSRECSDFSTKIKIKYGKYLPRILCPNEVKYNVFYKIEINTHTVLTNKNMSPTRTIITVIQK